MRLNVPVIDAGEGSLLIAQAACEALGLEGTEAERVTALVSAAVREALDRGSRSSARNADRDRLELEVSSTSAGHRLEIHASREREENQNESSPADLRARALRGLTDRLELAERPDGRQSVHATVDVEPGRVGRPAGSASRKTTTLAWADVRISGPLFARAALPRLLASAAVRAGSSLAGASEAALSGDRLARILVSDPTFERARLQLSYSEGAVEISGWPTAGEDGETAGLLLALQQAAPGAEARLEPHSRDGSDPRHARIRLALADGHRAIDFDGRFG